MHLHDRAGTLASVYIIAFNIIVHIYFRNIRNYHLYAYYVRILYSGQTYVTGFGKTDHIVTIDISRNTDLKYRSHHGSLVLDCSHARFAV